MILLIIACTVFICIAAYEAVRWSECMLDCEEERTRHHLLIRSPLCSRQDGSGLPVMYGSYMGSSNSEKECNTARRALRLSAMACAIRSFWRGSEPYRIYDVLAQSPLLLVATLGLLAFVLTRWHWYAQSHSQQPTELQKQIYVRYAHPPHTTRLD